MIEQVVGLIITSLIGATFIGVIIGFIIGRVNSPEIKALEDNTKEDLKVENRSNSINPIFKKSSTVENKPFTLSSPKQGGKDNLKKIKGITLQVESDLNKLGIYHFDQVASWVTKNCEWIENFLNAPNCVRQYQWIEQAKILKTGQETVYSQKVENGEIEVS